MTIAPSDEYDPTSTLPLWIPIPQSSEVSDVAAWADTSATAWCAASGADQQAKTRVATFLSALMDSPRTDGFDWRLVFMVEPDFGATVFDLALAEADPAVGLDTLVGATRAGQLGQDVQHFSVNNIDGSQSVRFDLQGEESDDERTISAAATTAVTRDVPPYGPVTLLARTVTHHIEPLATAMVPLQYLLTSEELLDLVSGTA
jgi:hypothetical protein